MATILICDMCENKATESYLIERVSQGTKFQVDICDSCAAKYFSHGLEIQSRPGKRKTFVKTQVPQQS